MLMLSRIMVSVTIGMLLSEAIPQSARADPAGATRPIIYIEDVARFYKLYNATDGHPTAAELQDYIDHGSEGLRYFAKARNTTGARIAAALAEHPPMYADARRCMAVLPRVRVRVTAALHKLKELYPEASLLPVTIVIGRGKPVAIGDSREGVEVGLESLCAVNWMNPNVEDRFVHSIAHEYGHVQQFLAFNNDEHPTVLAGSLMEAPPVHRRNDLRRYQRLFQQTTKGTRRKSRPHLSRTRIMPNSPSGSTTARSTSRATSATGSATGSVKLITSTRRTSDRRFGTSWKSPIRGCSWRKAAGIRASS